MDQDKQSICLPTTTVNSHLTKLAVAVQLLIYFCIIVHLPVPTTSVQGVLAKQAQLPCDVAPMDRNDVVFMVLWFREGDGEPLYRYERVAAPASNNSASIGHCTLSVSVVLFLLLPLASTCGQET